MFAYAMLSRILTVAYVGVVKLAICTYLTKVLRGQTHSLFSYEHATSTPPEFRMICNLETVYFIRSAGKV